jgi:hypothetical protein
MELKKIKSSTAQHAASSSAIMCPDHVSTHININIISIN